MGARLRLIASPSLPKSSTFQSIPPNFITACGCSLALVAPTGPNYAGPSQGPASVSPQAAAGLCPCLYLLLLALVGLSLHPGLLLRHSSVVESRCSVSCLVLLLNVDRPRACPTVRVFFF